MALCALAFDIPLDCAQSSTAVPFGTLVVLMLLWFGVSLPLIFFGAYREFPAVMKFRSCTSLRMHWNIKAARNYSRGISPMKAQFSGQIHDQDAKLT